MVKCILVIIFGRGEIPIMGFLDNLFNIADKKELKNFNKIVDKIDELEPKFKDMSDSELKNMRHTPMEYAYLCHINYAPIDGAKLYYNAILNAVGCGQYNLSVFRKAEALDSISDGNGGHRGRINAKLRCRVSLIYGYDTGIFIPCRSGDPMLQGRFIGFRVIKIAHKQVAIVKRTAVAVIGHGDLAHHGCMLLLKHIGQQKHIHTQRTGKIHISAIGGHAAGVLVIARAIGI